MPRLVIEGGRCLRGTIGVSGAKNAALPILAACLLSAGVCKVARVPLLRDVEVMQDLLVHLGASVVRNGGSMVVDTRGVASWEVPEELMRRMRASNLALGPLLGRFGRARMAYPGGCNIGARPMDLHLKGLQAMGVRITEKAGYITAEADRLRGADIHLDLPSVGATENLMMAAVLAVGTTVIRNAAREPEIVDLQNFLNRLGARIRGAGTSVIKIEGTSGLGDAAHTVIPDRIEAGTHLVAAAITGGDVTVTGCIPEHLEAVLAKLREAGAEVAVYDDAVRVWAPRKLRAVDLKTMPYPGFPTDMQAPFMALLTLAEGT
ncbi:MAG: UDP-N-acetylglucosamine 1-carboxyvinyltransferase, partial [Firmicutes bacterium]|nr:UDP-N-acetylglucosamine 1-carboxyvinyltransferase [Bacillota bacterium]